MYVISATQTTVVTQTTCRSSSVSTDHHESSRYRRSRAEEHAAPEGSITPNPRHFSAPFSRKRTGKREHDSCLSDASLELSIDAPDFSGPTSTEYTFSAVNGKLRAMGMQSAIPERHLGSGLPPTSTGRLAQYGPIMKLLTMDPLWDMTRDDAYSLVDDWSVGLGSIYPIVGRQTMLQTVDKVFDALDKARTCGLRDTGGSVAEALFDHDTNKLKIVLAIGMTKEAGGREHQAQRLFQSISEAVEGLIWNPEGIQGIQLLFLVVSAPL